MGARFGTVKSFKKGGPEHKIQTDLKRFLEDREWLVIQHTAMNSRWDYRIYTALIFLSVRDGSK